MGRISLEIVPRSEASFAEELKQVREEFSAIDTLNIPDILKFDVRIPEACDAAAPYFSSGIIPHIRAVSVNSEKPYPNTEFFSRNNINELLVILGDNPEIVSKSEHPCTSVELIKKIKKELPGMKVYAAVDQWRTTFPEEMEYVREKIDAGADGFFTQPFFDTHHMEKWIKALDGSHVFWGLAPVVRESSKDYWKNKNKVFFPSDFECTMEWNQSFARQVLGYSGSDKYHVYLCPITVNFAEYLKGIF
jgi:methylenetetrahydrofolate reductase (NADPH)